MILNEINNSARLEKKRGLNSTTALLHKLGKYRLKIEADHLCSAIRSTPERSYTATLWDASLNKQPQTLIKSIQKQIQGAEHAWRLGKLRNKLTCAQ